MWSVLKANQISFSAPKMAVCIFFAILVFGRKRRVHFWCCFIFHPKLVFSTVNGTKNDQSKSNYFIVPEKIGFLS